MSLLSAQTAILQCNQRHAAMKSEQMLPNKKDASHQTMGNSKRNHSQKVPQPQSKGASSRHRILVVTIRALHITELHNLVVNSLHHHLGLALALLGGSLASDVFGLPQQSQKFREQRPFGGLVILSNSLKMASGNAR